MKIDATCRAGDLAALREGLDDPASVPNGPMPIPIGPCLEYPICHSPPRFVCTLLELGADVTPSDHSGWVSVSGLRLGEACNLEVQDADLEAAVLTIRDAKSGESRLVPLHPSTCTVLEDYIVRRNRHW